jgi:hypothetical protein
MKYLRIIVLMTTAMIATACSGPEDVKRAIEQQGFTNVTLLYGEAKTPCQDDEDAIGFTALNKDNQTVSGTICFAPLEKSTIILN